MVCVWRLKVVGDTLFVSCLRTMATNPGLTTIYIGQMIPIRFYIKNKAEIRGDLNKFSYKCINGVSRSTQGNCGGKAARGFLQWCIEIKNPELSRGGCHKLGEASHKRLYMTE